MKAMVLAAGLGSRLGAITKNKPKCLVEIGGIPILERVILNLKAAGVTGIAINLHHFPQMIKDFLASKQHFGLEVYYSEEAELLDTGGGLKKAQPFFAGEESFFIHNADIYCTAQLASISSAHHETKALGTLSVMERPSTRGLYFAANNQLVGWSAEEIAVDSSATLYAFCCISLATQKLFSYMPERPVFSLIEPYLAAARANEVVRGYLLTDVEWVDIGKPEHITQLEGKLATKLN